MDETTKIEVTPKMIEAGVKVFCSYDSRFDEKEDIVSEMFLSMVRKMEGFQSLA